MEDQRKVLDQQLNFLSYLQNTSEDLIWEAYQDIVPFARSVIKPTEVKPQTIELMERMMARKYLYIEAQKVEEESKSSNEAEKKSTITAAADEIKSSEVKEMFFELL